LTHMELGDFAPTVPLAVGSKILCGHIWLKSEGMLPLSVDGVRGKRIAFSWCGRGPVLGRRSEEAE